jgi:hypothetical protein
VLDALALRLTEGHAAAAATLTRALERFAALDAGEARHALWLAGGRASRIIPMELWDFESGYALAARQVQAAREAGAFVQLQLALNYLCMLHLLAGELGAAGRLIEEDRLIAEATGNPTVGYAAMMLAAWQGREQEASELVQATARMATAQGTSMLADLATWASAVLDNGLGRYDAARDAARDVFERDQLGFGQMVVPELAEAAARTGDVAAVRAALDWLSERTRVTPTEWVLGIEARIRALLSDGEAAERCYRESVERLGRTRVPTSWPGRTCSTGNGCAGRGAASTPGSICAPPTRCWTRWACRRSPSGPAVSCGPPVRPPARASPRPPAPPQPASR